MDSPGSQFVSLCDDEVAGESAGEGTSTRNYCAWEEEREGRGRAKRGEPGRL